MLNEEAIAGNVLKNNRSLVSDVVVGGGILLCECCGGCVAARQSEKKDEMLLKLAEEGYGVHVQNEE